MAKRLLVLLMIFLVSCLSTKTPIIATDDIPDIGVPVESLNRDIYLRAPDEWNDFKIDNVISLLVNVASENAVVFPYNFGIRIFLFENDTWVEVQNDVIYLSNEDIVLQPGMDILNGGVVTINLSLPDDLEQVSLRIFIIGNVIREGTKTDEIIGSYIDVKLMP